MRFRKLRIAWSVFWGIACVLLIVLWVRSYTTFDRLTVQPPRPTTFDYLVISHQGNIVAVRVSFFTPKDIGRERKWINRDSGPINPKHRIIPLDHPWSAPSYLGFGWMTDYNYSNMPNDESGWAPTPLSDRSWTGGATGIRIPYWFLAFASSFVATFPWFRPVRRLRFSLRTLLIATTLIATVLGLAVWAAQ